MNARRSELTALFSSLKRIRPTVPFWRLAAHRIPTLWQLYRGLLRSASGHKNIEWRLRTLFRFNRHLTSPQKTKVRLETAHKWLDSFQKAWRGDVYYQRLMDRYDRLIGVRVEKENWKRAFEEEMRWDHKMRNRAILTGSIVRPTIYNRPFPRMKPQPIHISRIIYKRRRARERRGGRQELFFTFKDYIHQERTFEYNLLHDVQSRGLSFEPVFQTLHEWLTPLNIAIEILQESYKLDEERSISLYPPELLEQVKVARRERIRNKTREKERERRGEILNNTIRKMRKGPPAHILSKMTYEERKIDRLIRSPSEGGYIGMLKRQAGIKLKDDFTWRLEDGLPEVQEKLEGLEREFGGLQEEKRQKYFDHSQDEEEADLVD